MLPIVRTLGKDRGQKRGLESNEGLWSERSSYRAPLYRYQRVWSLHLYHYSIQTAFSWAWVACTVVSICCFSHPGVLGTYTRVGQFMFSVLLPCFSGGESYPSGLELGEGN